MGARRGATSEKGTPPTPGNPYHELRGPVYTGGLTAAAAAAAAPFVEVEGAPLLLLLLLEVAWPVASDDEELEAEEAAALAEV